jgi:hypothetical protein
MKYISAQPASLYYGWQIDVMLHSFVGQGVNLSNVILVNAIQGGKDPYFDKLEAKYQDANFYYYDDTRTDKTYISSIRPHILKKHFEIHRELRDEVLLYHDCDIALARPLNTELFESDAICYMSDTRSYIGSSYILSKGQDVFDEMVRIMRIDPQLVIDNENNTGGAQYILKGIDSWFWGRVESDCSNLFKVITKLNNKKKEIEPSYHELQIWCADMWAVLWNVWKDGRETRITDDLDFMFATNPSSDWDVKPIFHNAGVVSSNYGMFYKGAYINSVPPKDLVIDQDKASYKYYQMIKQCL